MALKDINFKKRYSSSKDNLLKDFYIPALSQAVNYYRLSGFFSSTVLAIAARGISKFIQNNGHMELICGSKLKKQDIQAIKNNNDVFDELMEKNMVDELNSLEDTLVKEYIKTLGWMVRKNMLEIKIALVFDDEGFPMDYEKINEKGLFHPKIGILEDRFGNKISFSGSINETAQGWLNNIEEIKVFRSWIDIENEYFLEDVELFNDYWNGNEVDFKVFDLPVAIEKKLIDTSPNNFKDLHIGRVERRIISFTKIDKKKIELRDYQKEAIKSWLNNSYKGIFEMATGTGKTLTALGCLKEVLKSYKRLISIIACPYGHLLPQWQKSIEDFNIEINTIIADSSNPKWKNELMNNIFDIKNFIEDNIIILTTHQTLSSDEFIEIIEKINCEVFLIADEVHGLGAPKRKKGLNNFYKLRLGLSATPKRWFDEEGTKEIFDYFGDSVYEFSLKKAINTINPDTKRTFLTPYEYKPYFIELTDEELEKYEEATKKIARAYFRVKDKNEKDELWSLLAIKRQEIIKTASGKYKTLIKILDSLDIIKNCLIYCEPHQIDNVQDLLNSYKNQIIIQHRFTGDEGLKPEKRFGGISERDYYLNKFAEGQYNVLVAMRCLDEGVDVPQAERAIIMSSTGNPRQYIQRRGRILRRSEDKSKAIIYDIIVIPSIEKPINPELFELERKILEKELVRYKEFAEASLNTIECLEMVEEIEKKYNIII